MMLFVEWRILRRVVVWGRDVGRVVIYYMLGIKISVFYVIILFNFIIIL